ncbi:MAG: hypothetical protein WD512_09005 [Candidatus Paceibacterota bacterium]
MDYAIIKSRNDLLEVVRLSDWQSYEWDDFYVVREKEKGGIKWFNEEPDAIDFMLEHFDKTIINPKYFNQTDNTGGYYIG